MPHALRRLLVSLHALLVAAGPFLAIAVALLALAYWWLDPNPPHRVRLATGPPQSAYAEIGERYKQALAAHGIDVVLVPSEGSAANRRLLRDGNADLGFVQGGSGSIERTQPDELVSLGSMFVEPVWLFYRADAGAHEGGAHRPPARGRAADERLTSLTQLAGLRVNLGAPGSGVPRLMQRLLEANQLEPSALRVFDLDQTPATVAFLDRKLDAIVFVSAPESMMVQMLLRTPGVRLMAFAQSEAYSRLLPFLTPVVLPRGVVDLAKDVPARNVPLVATTTSLLAREGTHPALLLLFAEAAGAIHGGAGWFNRAHEFPNAANTEYPLAAPAERYMRNGAPLLQRYLPFWLANLVDRMWLALGLIVAALVPLSRVVPPLYAFRIRSRVFRWYGRLREIEQRLESDPRSAPRLLEELDALDLRVGKVVVPLSYSDELYALRNYIGMVRGKLGHGSLAQASPGQSTQDVAPQ